MRDVLNDLIVTIEYKLLCLPVIFFWNSLTAFSMPQSCERMQMVTEDEKDDLISKEKQHRIGHLADFARKT